MSSNRGVLAHQSDPLGLPSVEWPTLLVAGCVYGGFALLTWLHPLLPWPLTLVLGGYLVAWHGSLQHEVVHGHPTRRSWLNEALVFPSLWLWLPFRLYRESHLIHHRVEHLTDPITDPESWYLTRQRWEQMGPTTRRLRGLLDTSPGRLLLAPLLLPLELAAESITDLRQGRLDWRAWGLHAAGVAVVLAWVLGVCDIPLFEYLLLYVYPGISLTLLRSFAEHQACPESSERTCAVETHPLLSLLFLNNNLHPAHHSHPGVPWYRLPALWRRQRVAFARTRPDLIFSGYRPVIRRFALSPRLRNPWPVEPGTGSVG